MGKRIFTGNVERSIAETDAQFKEVETYQRGGANVLYIVLDDLGFAALGCYGSTISTPNIDRLAKEGLRYNNFHTTAICSATRASLLTGANHHAVGVATITDYVTGYSNGIGHIDNTYGTLAEMLKEYGYSTYAVGKWHLSSKQKSVGPYEQWPLGRGFDRYYGFLYGEVDQFHPHLVRDNSYVAQPKSAKDGYILSEDLTDNAIAYIYEQKNTWPDKPFFLYLSYGSTHTPHHAPKKYIDKYKGAFDEGWDVLREKWFRRQKDLGVIPEDAELTERAEYVPAWDSLDTDRKKLYARYMEAYAGMVEHTDAQIGRLIDYLQSIDQLDNTIVVFLSDNGASSEGGIDGRFNAMSGEDLSARTDELEFGLAHIDEIGGEYAFNHYPSGWANLCNTPFQWYKSWSFEGGIKDPLIIRYPAAIPDPGNIRKQYHHVSDVTPTVMELLGGDKPSVIKGVPQKPFTGISMGYTLGNPNAKDRKLVQYYEMVGNRGIYKKGWKAVVNHAFHDSYDEDVWELYHVEEDYSEKHNVANQYPEKVKELEEAFLLEAGRNNVYPMMNSSAYGRPVSLADAYGFGKVEKPEAEVFYKNMFLPFSISNDIPLSLDYGSYYISVNINRPNYDEGVIFSAGDRFGGFVFYIKDNRLKYVYNSNRKEYFTIESKQELPNGKVNVKFEYLYQADHTADVTIYINENSSGHIKITRPYFLKGFVTYIRANPYTEISPEYESPFEFTGDIECLTIHSYGSKIDSKELFEKASRIE